MAYFVETAPAVLDYIAAVDGLSDDGRAAVVDGYIDELGRDADRFLTLYPLGPESLHFRYDYPHPDGGVLYSFDFVVDGTHMAAGVVRVVYVEHTTRPIS
jgi:hypothetical protein